MLIGELATQSGASQRALRYYEERGLLAPTRTTSGYRVYDDEAVSTVRNIKALLDAGFDSSTVAALLPCTETGGRAIELCPQVEAAMRQTLSRVQHEVDDATARRDAIQRLLRE